MVQTFRSSTIFPLVSQAYHAGEARYVIGYCIPSLVQGASHTTPVATPQGLVSMGFFENASATSQAPTTIEDAYYYDQSKDLYNKYRVLNTLIKLYITNNDATGTEDVTVAWRLFKPGEDPTGLLGLNMKSPGDIQRLIALGNVRMIRLGNRTDNNRNNCSKQVKFSVNPRGFVTRDRSIGQSSNNQAYGISLVTQVDRPDFVGTQDFRSLNYDAVNHPWRGLADVTIPGTDVLDATYMGSLQAPIIIFYAWRTSTMEHTTVQTMSISCVRDQTVLLSDRVIPAAS